MKSKIYTNEEIELLLQNPLVLDIEYHRAIVYDPIFKLWCVLKRIYEPFETSKHLFEIAGFPVKIMHPKLPQSRICSWQNTFYRYGPRYFVDKERYACIEKGLLKKRDNIRTIKDKELSAIYSETQILLEKYYESFKENRV